MKAVVDVFRSDEIAFDELRSHTHRLVMRPLGGKDESCRIFADHTPSLGQAWGWVAASMGAKGMFASPKALCQPATG